MPSNKTNISKTARSSFGSSIRINQTTNSSISSVPSNNNNNQAIVYESDHFGRTRRRRNTICDQTKFVPEEKIESIMSKENSKSFEIFMDEAKKSQQHNHRLWKVKDDSIPTLPTFYPIEKSSRRIFGHLPSIIAARIVACAHDLSFHATYDDDEAKAVFRSMDRIELVVNLWKPRRNGDGVIVEVQRRDGDSFHFQKYSRNILNAASGDGGGGTCEHNNNSNNKSNSNSTTKRRLSLLRDEVVQEILSAKKIRSEKIDIGKQDLEDDSVISSVDFILSMLRSDRWDVQELGMESLCNSTNTHNTEHETSASMSFAVLFGGTAEDHSANDLRDRVFSFIGLTEELTVHELDDGPIPFSLASNGRSVSDFSSSSSFSIPPFALMEESHNNLMRSLALVAFADALDVLTITAPNVQQLGTERSDFTKSVRSKVEKDLLGKDGVLDHLFLILGQAKEDPHNAYQSARSIQAIFTLAPIATMAHCQMIHGAYDALEIALDEGHMSHALLHGAVASLIEHLFER